MEQEGNDSSAAPQCQGSAKTLDGFAEKSPVVEHAWTHHHPIKWEDIRVIDRARRPKDLRLKEALHIQTTAEEHFNQDVGIEVLAGG